MSTFKHASTQVTTTHSSVVPLHSPRVHDCDIVTIPRKHSAHHRPNGTSTKDPNPLLGKLAARKRVGWRILDPRHAVCAACVRTQPASSSPWVSHVNSKIDVREDFWYSSTVLSSESPGSCAWWRAAGSRLRWSEQALLESLAAGHASLLQALCPESTLPRTGSRTVWFGLRFLSFRKRFCPAPSSPSRHVYGVVPLPHYAAPHFNNVAHT